MSERDVNVKKLDTELGTFLRVPRNAFKVGRQNPFQRATKPVATQEQRAMAANVMTKVSSETHPRTYRQILPVSCGTSDMADFVRASTALPLNHFWISCLDSRAIIKF